MPFTWHAIITSALLLSIVCRLAGEVFSRVLSVARNRESDYITALILTLILSPAATGTDYAVLVAAGLIAIASKYVLTLGKRHIFNPAAFGAFAVAHLLGHYPSWWVGTAVLAPMVFIGGLLIMRKMRRYLMVSAFMLTFLTIQVINFYAHHSVGSLTHHVWLSLIGTPILFFAYIMLLEPLTSPLVLIKYLPYALLVGVLYSFTRLRISPEESLLIGNLFAYVLDRSRRYELKLLGKRKEAEGIFSFVFSSKNKLAFAPGQYMEWTLPVAKSDSRGNRRYLTVSSSPTEKELMVTIRIPDKASAFKRNLVAMKPGDTILASHTAGSFTLPSDPSKKLAFIAGGVGITPFRSFARYLTDSGQSSQSTLLYCASSSGEFAFRSTFKQAESAGLRTIYNLTGKDTAPAGWSGSHASLSPELIGKVFPDFNERLFYLSGPYGFVKAARGALLDSGVSLANIKADYFPGYG